MSNSKRMARWNIGIRFLTFSCYQRLPLLGNPAIRDVFAIALANARHRYAFKLYAWVIMPEHVHLLLRPEDGADVTRPLRALKVSVAMTVIARWRDLKSSILNDVLDANGQHRFWQRGGGFDRVCRDGSEFSRHVQYIHCNPVERCLCNKSTDWAWSSSRWWDGSRDDVECDPPPSDCVQWGNPLAIGNSHQSLRD